MIWNGENCRLPEPFRGGVEGAEPADAVAGAVERLSLALGLAEPGAGIGLGLGVGIGAGRVTVRCVFWEPEAVGGR